MSAHPSVVPFQFFATADGYVAIAAPKEKFFRVLVERMGLVELASDPRFADFESRRHNREVLLARLTGRFAERTTADWLETLRGVIPIAPVRSMEAALDRDELMARGMLAEYDHPAFGRVRSIGLPLTMTDHAPIYRAAPGLGADGAELLEELGLPADWLARGDGGPPPDSPPEAAEA
jgi:crotonobetainyl-CoA:carnitine CoA-transferase CaiB-like acyl-CoA transferase